ncbi:MAG: ATP-binding protein [Victivallales bacterium]|nr:ATP-binding protein [Victivallales bacterium]
MIEVFLQKEAEHKSAAERAATSGDWATVAREAEALVRVYGAILVSGMAASETESRWQELRSKWMGIAQQARYKAEASAGAKKKNANEPKKETIITPVESKTTGDNESKEEPVQHHQTLKLDDVKGLAEAKQIVMDALVNPVKHPDIYKTLKIKSGKGLLLYGPPGTGKTMFARAIAGEMGLPFIYKKISELKDKYVGESEKAISRLFEEVYSHKQSIVFIDECEGLLRKRGNQKVNIVEAFLSELDGFATNREVQVFILLATNRPWLLDSAVTRSGRIGAAVHVGLPDAEARKTIISSALRDVPLADDVDIDEIVSMTEGYSGAELNHEDGGGVCNVAENIAGRRWIERRSKVSPGDPEWTRVEKITRDDFLNAIHSIVPVSAKDPDIIKKNLNFSLGKDTGSNDQDDD